MTMETVINVKCDGENCDHVRSKDTNHWLVGTVFDPGIIIISTSRKKLENHNQLKMEGRLPPDAIKDFCGEQCAVKWVSKMMTEIKQDKEPKCTCRDAANFADLDDGEHFMTCPVILTTEVRAVIGL